LKFVLRKFGCPAGYRATRYGEYELSQFEIQHQAGLLGTIAVALARTERELLGLTRLTCLIRLTRRLQARCRAAEPSSA
jgi:hypothetical protein